MSAEHSAVGGAVFLAEHALVVAVDISFGLRGVTFPLLWEHVGVFHGLRIPARMGLFVGLALSVLAAFGVAGLRSREASRRTQQFVAAIGMVLLVVENRVVLNGGQSMSGQMPPAYEAILSDLAGAPATAIADLPIAASMPTYMYYSVFHWQNLLSGYSGFFPPSFVELTRSLEHFPDVVSMDALRRRGARYVVVHGEVLRPEDYAAIVSKADADADLTLLSKSAWRGGEMSVYKIVMANADRP